jgi:hypothetical protein
LNLLHRKDLRVSEKSDEEIIAKLEAVSAEIEASLKLCRSILNSHRMRLVANFNSNPAAVPSNARDTRRDRLGGLRDGP